MVLRVVEKLLSRSLGPRFAMPNVREDIVAFRRQRRLFRELMTARRSRIGTFFAPYYIVYCIPAFIELSERQV